MAATGLPPPRHGVQEWDRSSPWLPQQFLMTFPHLCPALPSSFLVDISDIAVFLCIQAPGGLQGD